MRGNLSKTVLLLLALLLTSVSSSAVQAQQNITPVAVALSANTEKQPAEDINPLASSEQPITPAALTAKPTQPASSGLSLGKMAISLAIVVLIVLALGWTFKKLTLRLPGSRHIKIISTLSLGPKEKLLVIEMQGKQRVLGVTSNNINLLFELENSLPEEKLASDFHTQLQSFLKK